MDYFLVSSVAVQEKVGEGEPDGGRTWADVARGSLPPRPSVNPTTLAQQPQQPKNISSQQAHSIEQTNNKK